ncbi:hypothetical protein GPALN_005489 [Globodera pallida]|nr:hypothetical protein GPALN_005489 [Globodera pallida]
MHQFAFPLIFSLLCLRPCLAAIHLPYGVQDGDEALQFPEGLLTRRTLPKPFNFFERSHHSLFVSANGAVSFDEPFDANSRELDAEKRNLIAVFHAPSKGGKVFFRSADGANLLSKELSAKIRRAFGANQFEADAVVMVTWEELGREDGTPDGGGNTFQLALATDANETYALLVYSNIRWVKAADGRFAQAGFFAADGRSEKLLNSGSPNIGDVIKVSNFFEPGLFIYRVSGSHPLDPRQGQRGAGGSLTGEDEGDYEYPQEQQDYEPGDQISECPPDPYRDSCPPNCNVVLDDNKCSLCICSSVISENLAGSAYKKHSNEIAAADRSPRPLPPEASPSASPRSSDLSCTPREGRLQCHPSANCIQHNSGYCCQCDNGFFGNGVECLANDGPLRINGMFEAALNGKQMQRTDLFAYVQPLEGQQHTALAKVPPDVGWSLLLLDALSTPFGWLFAKVSGDGQPNGFQLSGGNFTRIVNIHLGERYALVIRQEFADRKFNEHFSVNVFVSGTLPELRGPVQVSVPEFEETFRRERPGLLRAYSERHINVRTAAEEETKFRVTTDQQIHFVECPHKTQTTDAQSTVKFERLNANFNQDESVVRFASQSRIISREEEATGGGRMDDQKDACSSGRKTFVRFNVCVPTSSSYRCECRAGFHLVQDNSVEQGITCQQIVAETPQNIGQQGTVAEQPLQPGECTRHDQCHQWGECVFHPLSGQPGKCKCRGWYVGDGLSHCGPPADGPPPQPLPVQNQPKGTICRGDSDCGDNANCAVTGNGYWLCKCMEGWRGDGLDCVAGVEAAAAAEEEKPGEAPQTVPTEPPPVEYDGKRKQCAEQADCHQNGHCILSDDFSSVHFCECLPGYTGDGVELCERSEECSPTDPAQGCPDPSEECRFEHSLQKFACHCRSGFLRSSGGLCEFQFAQSSGQCRQCGANAQCLKDSEGSWNCVCDVGFTGNGFECGREANCLDDPSLCSPNAQCLPDGSTRDYLCVCNYGFAGDGRMCEATTQSVREGGMESLLIGRGMAIIQRAPEPSGNGKQLIVLPHQIVVDIEFDCHSERLFWSDISGHSIRSAFLNGTELSSNFSEVLRSPEGIAIDWPSRNIYYLDSIKNELGVLSIDGRFQKTLLEEGLNNPRALVIDLEGRHLYYSDWSREGPKIGRVSLDGSGSQVFVSDDVHLPNGMVLLPQRRWLCWVDAGSQRLSCIGLDGTGRRVIYAPLEYPFGLTVNGREERFYWTDWKDLKIHSVDVFGKGYTQFLPGAGGKGRPYGVLGLPTKCRPLSPLSECANNNGGCAHWCLSGARHGSVICVCPDNVRGLDGC